MDTFADALIDKLVDLREENRRLRGFVTQLGYNPDSALRTQTPPPARGPGVESPEVVAFRAQVPEGSTVVEVPVQTRPELHQSLSPQDIQLAVRELSRRQVGRAGE